MSYPLTSFSHLNDRDFDSYYGPSVAGVIRGIGIRYEDAHALLTNKAFLIDLLKVFTGVADVHLHDPIPEFIRPSF